MKDMLKQVGAIPYRHGQNGLEVLLITSRGKGRWVIPKGNIMKGRTASYAAAREAYEEAGVIGTISALPLGQFTYAKKLASGQRISAAVEVYGLEVTKRLKKWPERTERLYEWMSVARAAEAVSEEGMKEILHQLDEITRLETKAA
jgi:8-oxo-dGTP pyrophosphatase MutT (NUDIX family)